MKAILKKMWKVYKYDGRFITGELISSHRTEAAAMKKAQKAIDFKFSEREKRKDEILIWLDGENHMPVGVITHEIKKGAKRLRQGKKKE